MMLYTPAVTDGMLAVVGVAVFAFFVRAVWRAFSGR